MTTARFSSASSKPAATGPYVSATGTLESRKRAQSSTSAGWKPCSEKNCDIVSRRPGLSATISVRPANDPAKAASAFTGSTERRSTSIGGRFVGARAMGLRG